jgi:branched-chain amino acid aminotransferase
MMFCFLNGRIIPQHEATLQISDLALLRGFGIFDYLQQKNGIPIFIEDYFNRFYHSASLMGLEIPMDREALAQDVFALIAKNQMPHSGLRFILTGGYSPDSFTPTKPNFFILEQPLQIPDNQLFEKGIKLMTHHHTREVSEVKSINYMVPILLQERWKAENAYDVLYVDDVFVTESSRSNFFIVSKDDILITADRNALKGITRKKVIDLAMEIMGVEIRDVKKSEIYEAKETFITSSTKGVLPVVLIDEHVVGDGKVGEWSKQLIQKFNNLQEDYIESRSKKTRRQ